MEESAATEERPARRSTRGGKGGIINYDDRRPVIMLLFVGVN